MVGLIAENFPHQWGIEHICITIFAIVLNTVGPILIGKFVKKQKTVDIILIISAILLVGFITTARISLVYYDLYIQTDPSKIEYTNWWQVLPDSFCSATSFAFGISLLINRKENNITLHAFVYLAIVGFLTTFAWPSFISKRPFWTVRTIFGLLHHIMLLWCALILIVTKRFKPNPAYWYVMPIAFAIYMTYGVFGIYVLGFIDAMNIKNPLIAGAPFTGWIGCGTLYIATSLVSSFSYYGYKCIKAKKLVVAKGKKNNTTIYNKVFCLIYYKKEKVLVVCYQNGKYEAFVNVDSKFKKQINHKKGFNKNKFINKTLCSKYNQVII